MQFAKPNPGHQWHNCCILQSQVNYTKVSLWVLKGKPYRKIGKPNPGHQWHNYSKAKLCIQGSLGNMQTISSAGGAVILHSYFRGGRFIGSLFHPDLLRQRMDGMGKNTFCCSEGFVQGCYFSTFSTTLFVYFTFLRFSYVCLILCFLPFKLQMFSFVFVSNTVVRRHQVTSWGRQLTHLKWLCICICVFEFAFLVFAFFICSFRCVSIIRNRCFFIFVFMNSCLVTLGDQLRRTVDKW